MAKEVAGLIKLQIKGGAANPSPPVGPALGSKGINIMEFCKQFNARTQDKAGRAARSGRLRKTGTRTESKASYHSCGTKSSTDSNRQKATTHCILSPLAAKVL